MPAIVCRRCKFRMDLLTVIDDAQARDALAAAMRLPSGVGDTVQSYLALFETDTRGLTWARYGAILADLVKLLAGGSVEWKGNRRQATLGLWVEAMQTMTAMDDLALPVKNHGYLRAMVYRKADARDAKAETAREQLRQRHPAAARAAEHGAPVAAAQPQDGPRSAAAFAAAAREKLEGKR
jgi:hypothetical protein